MINNFVFHPMLNYCLGTNVMSRVGVSGGGGGGGENDDDEDEEEKDNNKGNDYDDN